MQNLALKKTVTASDVTFPYVPSKAVNGEYNPFSRWQSNTVPCWLSVDLGESKWINRWVVSHMPVAGWSSVTYVNTDYMLQGSEDNLNWFNIDVVQANLLNRTDRTFNACKCRFLRLFINKGLKINPAIASVVELEIYPALED